MDEPQPILVTLKTERPPRVEKNDWLPRFKALVWPAITVALIVWLHQPIYEKVSQASEFGVAGLTLKIREQATAIGGPELAKSIATLAPRTIERLLHFSEADFSLLSHHPNNRRIVQVDFENELPAIFQLQSRGFAAFKIGTRDNVGFSELYELAARHGMKPMIDERGKLAFLADHDVSEEEMRQLYEFRFHLTESGKKARQSVVDAIVQQLHEGG